MVSILVNAKRHKKSVKNPPAAACNGFQSIGWRHASAFDALLARPAWMPQASGADTPDAARSP